MKRLRFILGAAALAAVAMTASPVINAQENGNRDENGILERIIEKVDTKNHAAQILD